MGMDAISRIEAGERKYKPQINHLTFADGFNNFINKLRTGSEPIISNLLNGQAVPPQADQQAFRS